MLYYVIFLLGITAHAHNCITKFVSTRRQPAAAQRSARHVRTAHKLAADSTGASHRLAPVLDPNLVSGRIFFVIKHFAVAACDHARLECVTQAWWFHSVHSALMWKFSWILQSDWISRKFLIKIWTMWQITSCSCCRPNAWAMGMSFIQCTVIRPTFCKAKSFCLF